jgi:pimeloyl-ACP methyl ester carboxylesterase
VREIAEQCAEWPRAHLPSDWHEPPTGETPFLLLSGWLDPIAAPGWAEQLTAGMPNARRILVREGHHNFPLDACGRETLARFFDTADAVNLEAGCIAAYRRPAFLVRADG